MATDIHPIHEKLCVHVQVMAPGLSAHAARLGCRPRDLCTALLLTAFSADLVDNILDGDRPEDIVGAAPRYTPLIRLPAGDRPLRGASRIVFDWLCQNAGPDGEIAVKHGDLAAALAMDLSTAHSALLKLQQRGLVEQLSRGVRATPNRYRLLAREAA
jgi:hypothetical protein